MLYFSINLSKWIHNFFPLSFTHSVQYHNNHCSTKQAVFSVWCWPVSFKNLSCQMLYPFQHQECCLVRNVLSLGSETMISTCRGKATITDALGLEHSHGGGKWPSHQITLLHTTCMFEAESLVSWQGWVWVSRTLQYGELGLLGNATTTAMHGWGSNHACCQWKFICKDLVTSSCGAQSLITTYSPLPPNQQKADCTLSSLCIVFKVVTELWGTCWGCSESQGCLLSGSSHLPWILPLHHHAANMWIVPVGLQCTVEVYSVFHDWCPIICDINNSSRENKIAKM